MTFDKDKIYKNLAAEQFNADNQLLGIDKDYCYLQPIYSGDYLICDCAIVDIDGRVHPGYNACGVPIHKDNLGEAVSTGNAEPKLNPKQGWLA